MESNSKYFESRQKALRRKLVARKLPSLMVTKPASVFYLTGFRGSAGIVIWSDSEAILLVDPRYTLQALDQAHGVEVVEVRDGLLRAAGRWFKKRRVKRTGFEESSLTWAEFQALRREAPAAMEWQPAANLLETLRVVKDDLEISQIREACRLTAEVYEEMIGEVRPGISESDVAAELEFRMRRKGAEGAAFETIVASGARAALPHARASAKLLKPGELVILDLGAILGGYMADMTRTIYLGTPPRRVRSLYGSVLNAQERAMESLHAGVRAQEVDMAARSSLAQQGLADHFTHSTGHGVGIEIHELPRLGKSEKKRVPAGAVVTVEPGIYLKDFGGIRIEDTVLVTEAGTEILTQAAKDPWWIE